MDALRFLAALAVVAFHLTGINPGWEGRAPAETDTLGRWAAYGAMGVPLFFVISGFVVLMTAWGRDVPHFVASRIGRLFPAYWVAVGIAAVFAFVLWPAGSVSEGVAPTKGDALVNLTMLQGAFGVRDLDGAFWTLWTEARFYVLVAVLVVVGITRRRVLAFAALWPLAGALAQQAGQPLVATVLIADYSPYFAGGMLLYLLHRCGHDLLTWLLVGMQALFALHFALGYYPVALTRATGWATSGTLVAVVSTACFGLVALVTLTRVNRVGARWMTTLGALTYPLYLVHEKLGHFVIHLLAGRTSAWLVLAAALAAPLALAVLVHRAVERPFGLRLRTAVLTALRRDEAPEPTRAPAVAGPAVPAPAEAVAVAVATGETPLTTSARRPVTHPVPMHAGSRSTAQFPAVHRSPSTRGPAATGPVGRPAVPTTSSSARHSAVLDS